MSLGARAAWRSGQGGKTRRFKGLSEMERGRTGGTQVANVTADIALSRCHGRVVAFHVQLRGCP